MNETMKTLLNRRSVRAYSEKMPEDEKIKAVVDAGLYAPSGRGSQDVKIVVVKNASVRNMLSEENRKIGGWKEGFDPFYGAPVVLVVLAEKDVPTHVYDGSLCIGNMLNAAYSLGLGSCWIHRAKEFIASKTGEAFLDSIGLEGDYEGIGNVILGYPEGESGKAEERKEDRVLLVE